MLKLANKQEWIKGKTVEELINLPLNELEKLTESQLRTVVGRGVSAGNKRLRRFEKRYNKIPYAGKGAERDQQYEQVKFSAMGKDRQELMQEFARIKSFMKAETSSVTGYEQVKRKSRQELKERYGINVSKKDFDDFWEVFEKLKELKPEIKEKGFKYTVLENIKTAMKDKRKELKNNNEEWTETTPEQIALELDKAGRIDTLYKVWKEREIKENPQDFFSDQYR